MIDPDVRRDVERWRRTVEQEAHGDVGATTSLVLGLIARESRGEPTAAGPTGDYGLMQITEPAWQDYTAENPTDSDVFPFPDAMLDPVLNVRVGAWFLARKIAEMGNTYDGLRAYNAGTVGARRDPTLGSTYATWIVEHGEPAFRK